MKAARDRAGLSQDEVAERLGMRGKGRASVVSRWESGQRGLPAEQVVPLAEILGCSPSYIVGAEDEEPREVSPREAVAVLVRHFGVNQAKAMDQSPPEGAPPPALPRDQVPADAGARVSEGLYDRGRRKRAGAKKKSGQR